jgi:hypothetical protein
MWGQLQQHCSLRLLHHGLRRRQPCCLLDRRYCRLLVLLVLLQLQELLLLQRRPRVLLRCQQLCDCKGVGSSHQLEPVPAAVHALQAQRCGVLALTDPVPLQVYHSLLQA